MAGLSDTAEQALLSALLNNDSTSLDSIIGATRYLSMHTADPTDSGSATSSEISYTGYARVAVTSSSAWSGTGATRTNAADITFGTCTSGSGTATHVALVTSSSGAGTILAVFALSASLAISSSANYSPRVPSGTLSLTHGGIPSGTASAYLDALLKNDKTALNALVGATRYVRMHSADPSSGTAVTSEVTYTGYNGVGVTSSSGWTTSGTRSNTGLVTFGTCTAGSAAATHFSLCTTQSGAGSLLLVFPRGSTLTINTTTNATPEAAIGALTATQD